MTEIGTAMTDDEIIESVRHSLIVLGVGDIKRAYEGRSLVGAFTLCCCLLDSASGYCCNGNNFESFCVQFLHKVNRKYRQIQQLLYTALRNGLVHSHSPGIRLENGKIWRFALSTENPEKHLTKSEFGDQVEVFLNLDCFIADVEEAINRYFISVSDLKDPHRKRKHLLEHAKNVGWLKISREFEQQDCAGILLRGLVTGTGFPQDKQFVPQPTDATVFQRKKMEPEKKRKKKSQIPGFLLPKDE
ncbi:MAG: hypothetical protein DKT66_28405 [Candidatus Melainabacteria bacterium]|jgi:hypothetical protein|nr:hypothetical protein [Candidatus Obscuribacterales bacterium]PZM77164.1 MAG: hypothetical protein DKT66_28405 [Candidatus Melainabacteria bacterium]